MLTGGGGGGGGLVLLRPDWANTDAVITITKLKIKSDKTFIITSAMVSRTSRVSERLRTGTVSVDILAQSLNRLKHGMNRVLEIVLTELVFSLRNPKGESITA